MKNKETNLTKFFRLNIVLLAINIAILVVWSMISISSTTDPKLKLNSNEFLKDELQLNEIQFDSINRLDQINFEHYQRILHLLCTGRRALLQEVSKQSPDKDVVNKITLRIGHLHTALKRQTVNHLLNIKKVCNKDQQDKLRLLFEEILEVNNQCKYCKVKCKNSTLK